MNPALSGKTAIVTDASSGIGRATALNLARSGAAVVVNARRRERLDQLVSEIVSSGGRALAVAGDARESPGSANCSSRKTSQTASAGCSRFLPTST